ncbi:uncharacterized protein RHO25_002996 [Cercospora beticola]|uniref:Uncharacterized protein n=1 Tax=Cercospora beticola TaxID=122368 RepID=A0ABZ0NFZ1_CERBT|nr:hypothetical protein RHO25_002996 [Cercospora beticola]
MTSNAPESLAYKELVFCLQLEPFLDEEDIEVWNARSPAASRVIIRFIVPRRSATSGWSKTLAEEQRGPHISKIPDLEPQATCSDS